MKLKSMYHVWGKNSYPSNSEPWRWLSEFRSYDDAQDYLSLLEPYTYMGRYETYKIEKVWSFDNQ